MRRERDLGALLNPKTASYVVGSILLLFIGFAAGFTSSLHIRTSASNEVRELYLQNPGDAPPAVRSEVLITLRAFQDGYIKRDPKDIDRFANGLIAKNDDVVLLGTDAGEWVHGYSPVTQFIKADWLGWGDLRFAVDDSIISSSGNVAWITSIGIVHFKGWDRPVRLSAVVTKNGSSWLFREIHFQWDDEGPSSADLLHPKTYFTLARLAFRRITNSAS